MSVVDGCFWEISRKLGCCCTFSWLAACTSLVFSVFGQCCVSKNLSAKIGSVPVSCVVASLAFPASSASGT